MSLKNTSLKQEYLKSKAKLYLLVYILYYFLYKENERTATLENKSNLEKLVSDQKISPAEAERLYSEKEALMKTYSALKASRAEWSRQVAARERENIFRLDQLGIFLMVSF